MKHEPLTVGTKICKGPCGKELHVLAFASHASAKDGLNSLCRACAAIKKKGCKSNVAQAEARFRKKHWADRKDLADS